MYDTNTYAVASTCAISYTWGTSYIHMGYIIHTHGVYHTYTWGISYIHMGYIIHTHGVYHTHTWGISYIQICYIIHDIPHVYV